MSFFSFPFVYGKKKKKKHNTQLINLRSGIAFSKLPPGPYYPGISLKHKKTCVSVNFGTAPFKFLPEDCLPLTRIQNKILRREKLTRQKVI